MVFGYVRVSSQEQAKDGVSLKRQEEQIHAYCSLKGIEDYRIIADEGVSGFKSNRPGFLELLQLCKSRQARMVIIYDLSRLSRSVRDTLEFVEGVIQKQDIEFVSLQNDIDTSTPMGKAFLSISAVFNQFYRDEISYKTQEALRHKREKGEKTGGEVPFGYIVEASTGRLLPCPTESRIAKQILALRKQGLTLRSIAGILHATGVKTKTGKDIWHPQVIKDILDRHK
jgi:site-specific DNA recombinase